MASPSRIGTGLAPDVLTSCIIRLLPVFPRTGSSSYRSLRQCRLHDRCRAIVGLEQVAVSRERENRRRMAEPAGNGEHVKATRDQSACMGMPQTVQRDFEARPLHRLAPRLSEPMRLA